MLKGHELALLHVQIALTSIFVTKGLVFSIWVPVIVSLVVPMVLVHRVVEVTPQPRELRNVTEVERHLGVFSWLIMIISSDWVELLHEIRVHDGIS